MKKAILLVIILMLGAIQAHAESYFVRKVIDAQTLQLLSGEIVKLIGVEILPDEKVIPKNQFIVGEMDSRSFVRGLVSGNVVELEFDHQQKDENGNYLAYVWVRYPDEGFQEDINFPDDFQVNYKIYEPGNGGFYIFLNASIIKAGYGKPVEELANTRYQDTLHKMQVYRQAIREQVPTGDEPVAMLQDGQ